jgi:diguanylate cyclase (GGDEF)-like protein/PAS domain S-box-containing protein
VQLIELQIPGAICSVLRVDEECCLRHLVAPHLPRAYIEAIDREKIGPNHSSCGTAACTREAVIAVDITNDSCCESFRELALAHDLRACWSHPIIGGEGRLLGVIATYFHEPRTPQEDELSLLEVTRNIAAVAIEATDLRISTEQAATQYHYLFESNPNPMFVCDTTRLCFLSVNDAAIDHYGYTRDELLQMSLRNLLPLQDLAHFEQNILPSMRDGGTTNYTQLRHRNKCGDLLLVDIALFPIEFASRSAWLMVVRDITDIECAQLSLEERDRQFELLLQSTSEGIYGIDNLGRITFANRACAEILGYDSPSELVGLTAHQALHHSPLDLGECDSSNCPVAHAMSTGQRTHADDQRFWHRDGFPVPVEYWYYPMQREGMPDGAIVTFFDISDRHAQREALRWQATHDLLTGLPNRIMLSSALQQAIVDSDASGDEFALLMIDLDQFKEINDTLGHYAGDELLRALGPRLAAELHASETLVRLGGDEFAVVLQVGLEPEYVAAKAQHLIQVIEQPVDIAGTRVQISASMGAAFYPHDCRSPDELMRCADVAMYEAKRSHLRYMAYVGLVDNNRPERLTLMSDLRSAIATQGLSLFYQPKLQLESGAITGCEALVRWQHPHNGMISPADFVPWIECSDLVHPFTAWVIEAAIAQCQQWREQGICMPVAINISTANLLDSALPEKIKSLLQHYSVPVSSFELEITESSIMANPQRSLEVVNELVRLGLRVVIDDFGTGYSSLGYLQRLPVSCVKIDRSFVSALNTDQGARLVVSAIIELSHKLELDVIAEGVEDAAILATLRELGCDQVQGFYFARPIPAESMHTWVREHTAQLQE